MSWGLPPPPSPGTALSTPPPAMTLGVCVCTQSCPILCDPMDFSLPGSSVHGIFQVRTLEWVVILLLQGTFLTQGLNLHRLYLLHWQVDPLPPHHLGSPRKSQYLVSIANHVSLVTYSKQSTET